MYSNILVPVSFDDDRDAAGAIEIAKALAAEGATVTLFHVMEQVPAYALSYITQEHRADSRKAIEAELLKMASEVPGGAALVVEGHSGRTILDWAEQKKVDCIVIASHRPGMQDLFLGSTATQVVRHASCAVHVIR